jgi:tRNA pseudouridine38-40 synthase
VYAYRVAYDGTPYRGFQRQPDVRTVEGELLSALSALGVVEAGTPAGYAAAGRTDAGVSARCQTVAFDAPDWLSPSAFNSELPESIRVWARADVDAGFHATHHATEREYTYFLHAPDGDEAVARQALDRLAGTHDFHNFTPDETGTERTLRPALVRDGSFLVVTLQAGGFSRQLVRRLVSAVDAVARGSTTLDWLDRLLSAESVDGPQGVGPAPPEPLVLTGVSYPDCSFVVDADAAAQTRTIFSQQRSEWLSRARVAGVLAAGGNEV